jgi:trehalose 6-phosphate phosphatase
MSISETDMAAGQSPGVLPSLKGWALFLDFDGTLIDIADSPDAVVVPSDLPRLLQALHEQAGGAVGVVTGRSIDTVDDFLAPLTLPVAGIHGAEMRFADGQIRSASENPALKAIGLDLRALVDENAGLLLEDKGRALAVHYRQKPELGEMVEAHVRGIIDRMEEGLGEGLDIQPGKMVVEIRPAGINKGRAVEIFLEQAPFAGRRPLVIGDDWTDEAAFRVANKRGGRSIRVGRDERPTEASEKLSDPQAVRDWLARLLAPEVERQAPVNPSS